LTIFSTPGGSSSPRSSFSRRSSKLLADQLGSVVVLNLDRLQVALDLVVGDRELPPLVPIDTVE
jgi:hypothetical protein